MVLEAMERAGRPPKDWPPYRAEVELTFHFPDRRRRDPDNYTAGCKALLDALVVNGLLADDSFDHISLKVRKGQVDPENPRTEVAIREVG